MRVVYKPEGDAEPQTWEYDPRKLMSVEREKIESLTGKDFSEFTKGVMAGNSRCRRALLFVLLKRKHPTLKFDDVDFAWDELEIQMSKQEYRRVRDATMDNVGGDQLDAVRDKFDQLIEGAYDDPGAEGKALLPVAE